MGRPESPFVRLIAETMELEDDLTSSALRDGVIDAAERHMIERTRFITAQLEVGELARLRSEAIQNTWDLHDRPHMQRRIRELFRDLGPEAA